MNTQQFTEYLTDNIEKLDTKHGIIAQELTGVKGVGRQTAAAALNKMVETGLLTRSGSGSPYVYKVTKRS